MFHVDERVNQVLLKRRLLSGRLCLADSELSIEFLRHKSVPSFLVRSRDMNCFSCLEFDQLFEVMYFLFLGNAKVVVVVVVVTILIFV